MSLGRRLSFFLRLLGLGPVLAAVCCSATAATVVWDFDRSDMLPARMENATASMTYFNGDPSASPTVADVTWFGVTGQVAAPPHMPDGRTRFLYHKALPNYGWCGYAIDHTGFRAATADGRMNAWTIVFDVYIRDSSSQLYNAMFNSDPALGNAAEWYFYPDGAIGHGDLGVTAPGAFSYDQWHRVGLVYDRPNSRATYWIDGVKRFEGPAPADDRYLLWASGHAGNDLVFQGDHSDGSPPLNYTSPIYTSSLAISDFAYSDARMQSLGGPSAAGIPLPGLGASSGSLTEFTSPAQLDLTGSFRYAVNVGGATAPLVYGLRFQAGQSAITGYQNTMSPGALAGAAPDFGDSPDINALEEVLQTMTYDDASEPDPSSQVILDVTAGETYKLQLLFWQTGFPRTFDVSIEGQLVLDEFNPVPADMTLALLYTHQFVAGDSQLNIVFTPGTSETEIHVPILNALTLERITAVAIPGDANGDGRVNQTDAAALAAHWGQAGDWADGDFNGDGHINASDASILAANWGHGTSEATGSTVPEPLGVLMLLQALLLATRRRR